VVMTILMSHIITVADRNPGWRSPILLGWTGMRGVVSLAAALSIPVLLDSGHPFPNRDLILFITFTVILITLVLQGLTLPSLARWVNMPDPDYGSVNAEQQRQMVRKKISHVSLKLLNEKYSKQLKSNDMVRSLKIKLEADMDLLKDWSQDGNDKRAEEFYHDYREIMTDLMAQQRALLLQLNKKDGIADDIIRHQLELIDLEEEKMRQHFGDV